MHYENLVKGLAGVHGLYVFSDIIHICLYMFSSLFNFFEQYLHVSAGIMSVCACMCSYYKTITLKMSKYEL